MDALKYPLSTEKSLRLLESDNTIVFIVDKRATKKDIKEALEKQFKVKVLNINIMTSPQAKKKAYVKLSVDTPALDIATALGLM